jgi:hypothetical protein
MQQPMTEEGRLGNTKPVWIQGRVARFFLVHDTKTGKNVPNGHKIFQTAIKYS